MFLNIFEVLDMVLMIFVMGFLFMSTIKPVKKNEDVLDKYLKGSSRSFDWHGLWFAALVTAPAIILHEFGHKLTALSLGFTSTFHAACSTANLIPGSPPFLDFYCGLTIVSIVLKLFSFGFIFFYSSIRSNIWKRIATSTSNNCSCWAISKFIDIYSYLAGIEVLFKT